MKERVKSPYSSPSPDGLTSTVTTHTTLGFKVKVTDVIKVTVLVGQRSALAEVTQRIFTYVAQLCPCKQDHYRFSYSLGNKHILEPPHRADFCTKAFTKPN